uniref:DUF985 domain-containing protein n=1 Tax=Candidatus Kentrum sp. TC TaxID=2126339 RepID=A0A450YFM7_9GAMM|nr:MAG: hypothetical protein BECKTC1821E_GA0114239_10075 [Candidatus Kentron sp. TC]
MKNKENIIRTLNLERHIEGGYFRETYRSENRIETDREGGSRSAATSIYFMLTDDNPINYFHMNRSDAIHYFHGGAPLRYFIVHPDGALEKRLLGADWERGCESQVFVKGGCWKATVLQQGSFGLIGEIWTPGFDYRDAPIAKPKEFKALFPDLWEELSPYVKPFTEIP